MTDVYKRVNPLFVHIVYIYIAILAWKSIRHIISK